MWAFMEAWWTFLVQFLFTSSFYRVRVVALKGEKGEALVTFINDGCHADVCLLTHPTTVQLQTRPTTVQTNPTTVQCQRTVQCQPNFPKWHQTSQRINTRRNSSRGVCATGKSHTGIRSTHADEKRTQILLRTIGDICCRALNDQSRVHGDDIRTPGSCQLW